MAIARDNPPMRRSRHDRTTVVEFRQNKFDMLMKRIVIILTVFFGIGLPFIDNVSILIDNIASIIGAVMSNKKSAFVDDDYCFACGSKNPLGLCLRFELHDDGSCTSEFTSSPHHQGFAGVVHGGLIATIADDLMNNHLHRMFGLTTVTAELTTRFRKPTPTCKPILFTSRRLASKGRIHEMECTAQIMGEEGILSISKGRFLEVKM